MGPAVEPSGCVVATQEGKVRCWSLVLCRLWCVSCPQERLKAHWDGQTVLHEVFHWCCICLLDVYLTQSKFGDFLKSGEGRGTALGIHAWLNHNSSTLSCSIPKEGKVKEGPVDQGSCNHVSIYCPFHLVSCFRGNVTCVA